MSAALYEVNVPPQILSRGFWPYAWKIIGPTGQRFCYVGMTGDVSGVAQSPYARAGAHLGSNPNSNALRQHLARKGVEPEKCKTLTFLAYGPVVPYQPKPHADFEPSRKRVGALERKLWTAAAVNNTMLNAVRSFQRRLTCRCGKMSEQSSRLILIFRIDGTANRVSNPYPERAGSAKFAVQKFWAARNATGLGCAKTKSDLGVMPSGRPIFAFSCSPHDHRAQNSGCAYTA
jgi:hypothetical protein